MKRKLLCFTSVILIAVLISGCTGGKNIGQNSVEATGTAATSEVPASQSPEANVNRQADAYYLVFKDMYEKDTGLNADIDYLALDLSAVKSADTDTIAELFATFCGNNNLKLLLDTSDGLIEKGFIKDMTFEKGLLVSFKDQSVSDNEIITDAAKWRSAKGAGGATYTVSSKDGIWEISDISGMWKS